MKTSFKIWKSLGNRKPFPEGATKDCCKIGREGTSRETTGFTFRLCYLGSSSHEWWVFTLDQGFNPEDPECSSLRYPSWSLCVPSFYCLIAWVTLSASIRWAAVVCWARCRGRPALLLPLGSCKCRVREMEPAKPCERPCGEGGRLSSGARRLGSRPQHTTFQRWCLTSQVLRFF